MEPGHYAENSIFNIGFLPQTWADGSSLLFPISQTGSSSRSSSRGSTPPGTQSLPPGHSQCQWEYQCAQQTLSGRAWLNAFRACISIRSGSSVSWPTRSLRLPGALGRSPQGQGTRSPVEADGARGCGRRAGGRCPAPSPWQRLLQWRRRRGVAWKVVVVASGRRPRPGTCHGLADLERLFPAVLEQVQEWLRFSRYSATACEPPPNTLPPSSPCSPDCCSCAYLTRQGATQGSRCQMVQRFYASLHLRCGCM